MPTMTLEALSKEYDDFYAPRFSISVAGTELTEATGVVSGLSVDTQLDAAAQFSFTLTPPFDHESGEFEQFVTSESGLLSGLGVGTFEPFDWEQVKTGTPVTIRAGYGDNQPTIFNGTITSVRPNYPSSGGPSIELHGYDNLQKLAGRHETVNSWDDATVEEVVTELVAPRFTSLDIPATEETTTKHPKIERQPNEGDLSFVLRLARRTGREVFVVPEDGRDTFVFRPAIPDPQQPVVQVRYGESLRSFSPEVNSADQVAASKVTSYDQQTRQMIEGVAEHPGGGDLVGRAEGTETVCRPVRSKAEAKMLARARMNERLSGLVRGNGETIGIPEIRAGETIHITKLGGKYSGKYYVESAEHGIGSSGYTTRFTVQQRKLPQ